MFAKALPNEDHFRLQDVSMMLCITVRDLEMQKALPADVKTFADGKLKGLKSLKFKEDKTWKDS